MDDVPGLCRRECVRKGRHGCATDTGRYGFEDMPPVVAELDTARHTGRQGEIGGVDRVAPYIGEDPGRNTVSESTGAMTCGAHGFKLLLASRNGFHRHRRFLRDLYRSASFFIFPAIREYLDELDNGKPLLGGDFIPGRHRGSPQTVADCNEQIFVQWQRSCAAGGRAELECARSEIARLRIQEACGRTVAVALFPVTAGTAAEINLFAARQKVQRFFRVTRL